MMVPTALGQPDEMARLVLLGGLGLDLGEGEHVGQLADALVDEVAAADEHDDVAHREAVAVGAEVHREQRRGHMHQVGREAKEQNAHNEGAGQAQLAADMLLLRWKAVGGDGDEHQVVHAQNYL